MADSDDDVLQKADAFMRRHRVFVAGAAAPVAEEPAQESPAVEDTDIPVLTEIVAGESGVPPTDAMIDPAELQNALAAELDAWLDEQLPAHVMRVLDGITDQMIGQLSEKARSELLPRLQARLGTLPEQDSDEV